MGQPACLRDHGEAVGWSGVDKEEATEGRDRKLVRRDFNSWAGENTGSGMRSANTGGRKVAREGRMSGIASV